MYCATPFSSKKNVVCVAYSTPTPKKKLARENGLTLQEEASTLLLQILNYTEM